MEVLQGLDFIDGSRIYAAGYSLGATVGLLGAALDQRIAGVVSVCGFTPLRTAGPQQGIEGIRAYSHLHGLIPRLGFFAGAESRTPVDFEEILACIAPRPVLVVAPVLDRDAVFGDVKAAVGQVEKLYRLLGAEKNLTFSAPGDYSRFAEQRQQEVADWLSAQAGN